ncbi:putative Golgi transport protein Sly1 [Sporormia fimetaria CBS 119925]|uniref:Golgi transport protein Sly1 n=1 Tax=Sporormia fimetaria CBS 119925 TaxID=1340428 RepID=A0A6A6V2P3_9PLEO|nr:putative Golgi transport protein Sly1 [Sporormia fimetaria CBS 119925]
MASLRDRQIASIERILNLNAPTQHADHEAHFAGLPPANSPILTESGEPIWKILVFDDMGRDVISSVLRVSDLRQWGVTVHLNINTTRHPIPDVPVIYLIEPTAANLAIVTSDLSRSLYSPAYINFLSSIPRPLLEDFAAQTAASGTAEHLAQIYDQYLNFIVSEPDLFSLNLSGAYGTLNSAQTSDETLDTLVDRIVSGLFSVVVTMGSIPIIRCPRGGAAEMISTKLDRKLRDHLLNSKTSLFGDQKSGASVSSRPVLVLADRNVDLTAMFSHSWTYQSLVTDLLHMHLNKITVPIPIDENNPEKGTKKQAYDLTASDSFWQQNATRPFPDVAEEIDGQLKKYEEDANEITKKTGTSSIDDLQGGNIAAHLKGALAALPELKERKALLTMHMNILKALIKGIEDRKVHEYFQLEEELSKQTKTQVLDIIKASDKGNDPMDKLRFFLQWYLTTESDVARGDLESFTQALEAAGADTTPINYAKTVRQLTRMTMISSAPTLPQQSSTSMFHNLTSLSSRVTDRFKDAGLTTNFDNLLSGITNLIPKNKDLTLTKIVESLMDPQNASSSAISKTENWLYFDPRSANSRGTIPPASRNQMGGAGVGRGIEASFGMRRQGFSEAIVFTVGGGSMDEYGNLMEWAKRTSGPGAAGGVAGANRKRVVYGSTALVSAKEFIEKDLMVLGKEST